MTELAGASDATLCARMTNLIKHEEINDGWFARMDALIAELKRRKATQPILRPLPEQGR